MDSHTCHNNKEATDTDYLLTVSIGIIVVASAAYWLLPEEVMPAYILHFSHSIIELIGRMWWGILAGIVFVGILSHAPRELVASAIGNNKGLPSILRATFAGMVFDLCSHGILMVGMKFYERGASLGQVMAFLIASPWNSFSLTIILISLIGIKWTLLFILLSFIIAVLSGIIFDTLVRNNVLPANPNRADIEDTPPFLTTLRKSFTEMSLSPQLILRLIKTGMRESRIVLRWVLFGIVLASLIRMLLSPETFSDWFGPTLAGLWLTLIAATVIEVCSEGATPIAADLLSRAAAPGNSFTFLMAGVSTDYTEIMSIKDTMQSWKIALFLPLVTLPQIMFIGWLLNSFS